MEGCVVCEKGYNRPKRPNEAIYPGNPPVCSGDCFLDLISKADHQGKICWVSFECSPCKIGQCLDCAVFKVEVEVFKRGLDKKALIGNY